MAMGLLRLLPQGLKTKLILQGLLEVIDKLEAQQVGTKLNTLLDAKYGATAMNPVQARVAVWLRQVAQELEA